MFLSKPDDNYPIVNGKLVVTLLPEHIPTSFILFWFLDLVECTGSCLTLTH